MSESLPGEAQVDSRLIDDVLKSINGITNQNRLEAALAVGRAVRRKLFADSSGAFGARQSRHRSFRELARHEKLDVSYAYLLQAVRVVDQVDRLGPELSQALSWSQHRRLLRVRSLRRKIALAQQAVCEGWSVRELDEQIRSSEPVRQVNPKVGRPPKPIVQRAAEQTVAALAPVSDKALDDPRLDRLPADQLNVLCARLAQALQQGYAVLDALTRAIEGLETER